MICDKKVPAKMKLLTVIRPMLLYGGETWPRAVKMTGGGNKRDESGAMGNGGEPTGTPEK